MKRRSTPPTDDDIMRALRQAEAGKGGPLADMVKAIPRDMLASAFAKWGPRLSPALFHAAGMLEERARQAAMRREWRKTLAGAKR